MRGENDFIDTFPNNMAYKHTKSCSTALITMKMQSKTKGHTTSIHWLKIKSEITSINKDAENTESNTALFGIQNGEVTLEKCGS